MHEGSILAGKYRLVSLLGKGGMGSVWRAEHLDLGAPVAVKLIDPFLASSGDGLARFHREAQAAAALRSPHVVQILDRGIDPSTHQPFIVMELMEGESLAARLAREGRLSPAETCRVVSHIARALSRAQQAGIVHRDLKPDNVFLVRNEEEEIAKVLDFGIAKSEQHLGQNVQTRTGAMMGTPYYMSPEQIGGAKGVDLRTDIWALGVIACECLTGRRPFDAETIGALTLRICVEPMPVPSALGDVPQGFDAWFARAAAREPAMRFQSARVASDELRRVCGVAPLVSDRVVDAPDPRIEAQTASTDAMVRTAQPGEAVVPSKPSRALLGVALALAAIAASAVVWFLMNQGHEEGVDTTLASATATPPVASPGLPSASAALESETAPSAPPVVSAPEPAISPAPRASASSAQPAPPKAVGGVARKNAPRVTASAAPASEPTAAKKGTSPAPRGIGSTIDERR
jgi:serine/threonine-protein kinase